MGGNLIDVLRLGLRNSPNHWLSGAKRIETDYGSVRVLDTGGNKPAIVNVPDGPNVIEHHEYLIKKLSRRFRVICFEMPGTGFSFPSPRYDYSLQKTARIILNVMDLLKVGRASLLFSCANGFYAIKAAELSPERFIHLFLAQTPSMHAMKEWVGVTIPGLMTFPVVGQLANSVLEKKLAEHWYSHALPKGTDVSRYRTVALKALDSGSCFCLSGLVQGLSRELEVSLSAFDVPATLVWGAKDFSHRHTDSSSIYEHLPGCELITFDHCGHFPELEDTPSYVKLVNERLN